MELELLVRRIISGTIRLNVDSKTFLIKCPTREELYEAQVIYTQAIEENTENDLYNEDDLYDFLITNGFWDENKEKLLESLPKEIEEFKLSLFQSLFKSGEKQTIRKALATARNKLNELLEERHEYDHLSVKGSALLQKSRYLLCVSSFNLNNRPVFGDFWSADCELLDKIISQYNLNKIPESTYRLIVRGDPWRAIWNTRKAENSLFGIPAVDYTEEQRALIGWSMLYDNIYEHPECPSEDVLSDDDILDGWLIDQKRKQAERKKLTGDNVITNDKIKNCKEVFIPADNIEDAKKIEELNSSHAKQIKRQRQKVMKQKGEINEAELPDVKRDLLIEFNKMQVK